MPPLAAMGGISHIELTGVVIQGVVAGYTLDPRALPGVPASRSYAQDLPSRFADPIALDGIELTVAFEPVELELDVPPTVNVVLTTGHTPLLVHDLKWIV
jgi:hypothetical protein